MSQLKQRFCSFRCSGGSLGINAPLTQFRINHLSLTTLRFNLNFAAPFTSSIAGTLPRFEIWVGALQLMPEPDALWLANNAFAAFPKTPASVEVSVAVLFAWFAELCAMRKLAAFHADDETGQPKLAGGSASCTFIAAVTPKRLLSAGPCVTVLAQRAKAPLGWVVAVDCLHRQVRAGGRAQGLQAAGLPTL